MASNREDYKDSRWQRLRLHAMDRDGWACVNCFKDENVTLHVHHKRYRGRVFDSSLDDLQTLCEECHSKLGEHPKGGVWWGSGSDECKDCLYIENCPKCGSKSFKDMGSSSKCRACAWRPPFFSGLSMVNGAKDTPEPRRTFTQVVTNLRRLGVEGVLPGQESWVVLARGFLRDDFFDMAMEQARSGCCLRVESLCLEVMNDTRRQIQLKLSDA